MGLSNASSPLSSSTSHTKENNDDSNKKSKDGPIKVIFSLFGLLVVVFIMFSVFEPKQNRPPDHKPLTVYFDKEKQEKLIREHNKYKQQLNNSLNAIMNEDSNNKEHIDLEPTDVPETDSSHSSDQIRRKDSESADIEFIESNNNNMKQDEIEENNIDEIRDLYLTQTNPLRPPQSIHIDNLSKDEVNEFWNDNLNEMDIFDSSNMPSADSNGRIYLMNYIFNPYEQMISIFLLTSEYLDPNHGLHAWPSKKRRNELPDLYKNIRSSIYKEY